MRPAALALRSPGAPAARPREAADPFPLLERRFTPRTVFMEIGSADSTLALRAAGYVERVYSIDVSGRRVQGLRAPCNLRTMVCDGVRIPVPDATVDIAWSGEFLDRLPPEAAVQHLAGVQRSLVSGGEYLLTTRQPVAEVRKRLFDAGFSVVRVALLSLVLKPVRIAAVK
jgi:hypothetical protein